MVRGTGPLVTVLVAGVVFAETYAPLQWAGVLLLSGGILGLAAFNLRYLTMGRDTLVPALGFALATGVMVAVYTTYDAWGIRATADPFTFLAWFFFLDGLIMPAALWPRFRALPRADKIGLLRLGRMGGLVAVFSFGAVMLATRLDKVGEAAVLRETSTVFAALIGWLVLGEKVGAVRAVLMAAIAAGAVIMEFGG